MQNIIKIKTHNTKNKITYYTYILNKELLRTEL